MRYKILFIVWSLCSFIPGESSGQTGFAPREKRNVYFFPALGENILSNIVLYLGDRYIACEPWAQISLDTIKTNLRSRWVWDGDEFFTNQFGHPYQGSIYHAAARSNGFAFYESLVFDAFGSATWEVFCETNTPSINDLISTTGGGASLGEMFHRLYRAIPSPFAALLSPADALNGLITGRRPSRTTTTIHRIDITCGMGYTYSRQSIFPIFSNFSTEEPEDGELVILDETHAYSADVSCTIVYGDPFIQQSNRPYDHFELSVYANIAYPLWYNINIRSDGYLFSFTVIDHEKSAASMGLSLHYDLFSDRHINFFGESLAWTFKYNRMFPNSRNITFKGHLGAVLFNADTFYLFDGYTNFRQTDNDYGAGLTMKLSVSTAHQKWGTITYNVAVYEVVSIFKNEHTDSANSVTVHRHNHEKAEYNSGLQQ